jgi:hypothetical protein
MQPGGKPNLLLLVFAFANSLQHFKTGFLRVGDGQGSGRIECGKKPAHFFLARRTFVQRRSREWPMQSKLSTAHLAIAFA